MHQELLAGRQAGAVEHVGPDREVVFGDGGGGQQVHAARHGQAVAFVGQAILGVAATRRQRAHGVAGLPGGDVRADGDDGAGDFQPQIGGSARRRRIRARALQHVGAVHAGVGHFDQDLAAGGGGHVALGDVHAIGRAALAVVDECAA
ncbi:hypothetical protein G6F57_019684 [Rhizopus arrhizus]|nr:hypothetical protein G6F57_019684 [Rhizopus arrhizus]